MSIQVAMRQGASAVPDQAEGVRVVKPLQLDDQTASARRLLSERAGWINGANIAVDGAQGRPGAF